MLTREQILTAPDLTTEPVPVPEWGEGATALVRGMSGEERDDFETTCYAGEKWIGGSFRAQVLVRCLVDAEGKRLFANADAPVLATKSGQVIDRLFAVAARLSGIIAPKDLKGN